MQRLEMKVNKLKVQRFVTNFEDRIGGIMYRIILICFIAISLFSCMPQKSEDARFEELAENYISGFLKLNPEWATYLGDHRFDHLMNDYSLEGVKKGIDFYNLHLDSLNAIDSGKLSKTNSIDYRIFKENVEYSLFRLTELKEMEWNPLFYNPGGAIYNLLARDFAPLAERLKSVKARLQLIPAVLEEAKKNLKNPPKVFTETAILQFNGVNSLVNGQLNKFLDEVPELNEEFKPVQENVTGSLESFVKWMEKDLLPRSNGEFRIGEEKFDKKLKFALESDLTKEQILEKAEKDLVKTQDAMYETAVPLHEKFFGNKGPKNKAQVIKAVLDELAKNAPNNDNIVELAKGTLETATEFVRKNDIVTVPEEPIEIIVMPEFERGYAVAYCDSPGTLEKEGKTFYAISPAPADWSKDRVKSLFREYNMYMLEILTIHEAMPGHYLQLAHANKFKAPTMIRAIFYSGTFVEGWATYAEQIMVEKGYGGPEVRMQQLKMRLRLIINSIIDQKIHTAGMTEQEAMDLMMNQGFQEEGEAAGKWRRACLSSTQLSTYYVGNIEQNNLRSAYEKKRGNAFSLKEYHDKLLSYGSIAPKYVRDLLEL